MSAPSPFHDTPGWLRPRAGERRLVAIAREVGAFGWHEALACLFPLAIFALLALSRAAAVPGLPRYDLLLLGCLAFQAAMLALGLETRRELAVICLFHLLGVTMELFKVAHGSWSYPEAAWSKVGGVPLYSGFMYAAVASYMCQAWRRLDLRLIAWPRSALAGGLGAAVYVNFFAHHYLVDVRWPLAAGIVVAFARTRVEFSPSGRRRRMPLLGSFALIGLFVWVAENVATYLGAWNYPHQAGGWRLVHPEKIFAWSLLVIVSLILVAELKRLEARRDAAQARSNTTSPARTVRSTSSPSHSAGGSANRSPESTARSARAPGVSSPSSCS